MMTYSNGMFTLGETKYECGNEYVLLLDTNKYHKVYYNGAYRKDANPYININGKRYSLNEFIRTSL